MKDSDEKRTNQADNTGENGRQVLDMFLKAVDQSGGISYRSTYGRRLKEIQEELSKDPDQTAAALLRADISHLALIKRGIIEYLLSNPGTIITEKGLNPLFVNDYIKIADATRRAVTALRSIEATSKPKGKGSELSEILFDDE